MSAAYLDWLKDLFEEAQVPFNPDTADVLDRACRRIAGTQPDAAGEQVYHELRKRWLRQGPPGRQLLAAHLRGEIFAKRDADLRPSEGRGYFVND